MQRRKIAEKSMGAYKKKTKYLYFYARKQQQQARSKYRCDKCESKVKDESKGY